MPKKLAAGNWKMNGTRASLEEIARLKAALPAPGVDVLICPPATLIAAMAEQMGSWGATGGQDCHSAASGAHTGDIAAGQLADAGAAYAIVGHSERRTDHGETDTTVKAKAEAAIAAGLIAVVCIGETLDQREAGDFLTILKTQLLGSLPEGATADTLVVAYEPVWAIGTGKVAEPAQIAEVHTMLREVLQGALGSQIGTEITLLYGGSVKPGNAAQIFALDNVEGALVGGASLKAEDFGAIISALATA